MKGHNQNRGLAVLPLGKVGWSSNRWVLLASVFAAAAHNEYLESDGGARGRVILPGWSDVFASAHVLFRLSFVPAACLSLVPRSWLWSVIYLLAC